MLPVTITAGQCHSLTMDCHITKARVSHVCRAFEVQDAIIHDPWSPSRVPAGGDPAKFQEINEAYDVLKNEEKRRIYDEVRSDTNVRFCQTNPTPKCEHFVLGPAQPAATFIVPEQIRL